MIATRSIRPTPARNTPIARARSSGGDPNTPIGPMTDEEPVDVWSGSSLNTFLRCAKQWEYAYVYRFKRPPKLRMVLGAAAHFAVETDLRQKITTQVDLPVGDVLDAFSTSYDLESVEAEEEPAKDI